MTSFPGLSLGLYRDIHLVANLFVSITWIVIFILLTLLHWDTGVYLPRWFGRVRVSFALLFLLAGMHRLLELLSIDGKLHLGLDIAQGFAAAWCCLRIWQYRQWLNQALREVPQEAPPADENPLQEED